MSDYVCIHILIRSKVFLYVRNLNQPIAQLAQVSNMLQAMNNLMAGRTSFVIAHRLSTIKDADKILYMQDGDIKEQGTHEELLAKGGYYAALYNSQFDELAG